MSLTAIVVDKDDHKPEDHHKPEVHHQNQKKNETNQIQVIINQKSSTNIFAANIGGSITNNTMTTLPAGATFIQNGFIYPKGTVNLNQQSFTVDKNGNPLTQLNSIGVWQSTNVELVQFNQTNPPAVGTETTQTISSFSFTPSTNPNNPNQIFTIGLQELINTPAAGVQLSVIPMLVLGGLGKNAAANGSAVAKIYTAPDGSQVMVVTFNKTIKLSSSC